MGETESTRRVTISSEFGRAYLDLSKRYVGKSLEIVPESREVSYIWKRTGVPENVQIDPVGTQVVAGGQIEIGDEGVLVRWCVTSYAWPAMTGGADVTLGGDTLKQTLARGRHVPLPLDRLWVVRRPEPLLNSCVGETVSDGSCPFSFALATQAQTQ